jgi:hypothetical protein
MAMTSHLTEALYRRYAITNRKTLKAEASKLATTDVGESLGKSQNIVGVG